MKCFDRYSFCLISVIRLSVWISVFFKRKRCGGKKNRSWIAFVFEIIASPVRIKVIYFASSYKSVSQKSSLNSRGESRIFLRGRLIFKKISKRLTTFFVGQKNRPKSRFWALFGKFWKKPGFFSRSPSKLVYVGAQGAFRTSRSAKNGFLKKYQKGAPWVGRGSNPWGGGGGE